jgi:hypothetical protein
MEKMARRGVVLFKKDTEGMVGIKALHGALPSGEKARIRRRSSTGPLELREQVLSGVIGKTEIAGEEFLVENGCTEETSDLLFFHGVAGKGQGMTHAGEYESSDAPFIRLKEDEFAIGEVEGNVRLVNFNTIFGGNEVDGLRIKPKSVKSGENIPRRVRGGGPEGEGGKKQDEDTAKPHDGV